MTLLKKLMLWNWRVVSATTAVGLCLIVVYWKALPPEVPLLYSRPWGQDQLVSPYFLWLVPALTAVIGSGLGFLGSRVQEETVLPAIMLVSSMVIQVVVCLGLIRIITLVV